MRSRYINKQIWYFLIGVGFLCIKLCLQLLVPETNTDGIWTLSSMLSFLEGDTDWSSFAHHYKGPVYTVDVFKYLTAPFYCLFGTSTDVFFIFNISLNFLFLYLAYLLLKNKKPSVYLLVVVITVSNNYFHFFRVEIIGNILGLLLILFHDSLNNYYVKQINIAVILAVSFLIHPVVAVVNGFIAVYLYVYDFQNKELLKDILVNIGMLISLLFLFSEFSLINHVKTLYLGSGEAKNHRFTLSLFVKYIVFNPLLVITLFIIIRRKLLLLFPTVLFVLLIAMFGRSYYFPYTVLLVIVMLHYNNMELRLQRFEKLILLLGVSYSFLFYYAIPSYVHFENIEYGMNMKKILNKVGEISVNTDDEQLLWCPSQFGMEVKPKNTRMYFHFYQEMAGEKIELGKNDQLLFYKKSELPNIYKNLNNSEDQLIISEIVPPVKGKLTIKSILQKRTDSIGLWSLKKVSKNKE